MTEFSKSINDTQILVHKAQWELEQLQESNKRMQELNEEMIRLCNKFLKDTEDSNAR